MSELTLSSSAQLIEAVRLIESTVRRIAIVTSSKGEVIGTLTDGDVRRCLLAGGSLSTPVNHAMNSNPQTAPVGSSKSFLLDLMKRGGIAAVPLVDVGGVLVKVVHITDLAPSDKSGELADFDFAVIMAGGEGLRLRPITANIPKSMVDIGGIPLLERQILKLARSGVREIYIAVNYLSHVIEEHFGDGSRLGVSIHFLKETQKLGTGGALSLLPRRPKKPIVVMNGDVLTTFDFASLGAFHTSHRAQITVAAIEYHVNIPFGVLHNDGAFVTGLSEKPSQRLLCNAGIYVLAPDCLNLVPSNQTFNMTDLMARELDREGKIAIFPIHEYWSDIGTPDELEKARNAFAGSL